MKTCNLIFWAIVMPIITFGSEIWNINDRDLEKLQKFQRYAGRRVQRFPKRSPSCTSYFGLGWIRIETYIQIKKLLFALIFISMDDDSRLKLIFTERVRHYVTNNNHGKENPHGSPVYEILNTAAKFGLLRNIIEMTLGYSGCIPKRTWSRIVWQKDWELDDMYWRSTKMVHKKTDILTQAMGKSQYLTWWNIADHKPHLQKMCETIARLVCHTSLLKDDDPRLIGGRSSMRMCIKCDLSVPETVQHLVMQCSANEEAKACMFDEIQKVACNFKERCAESAGQVLYWLLGKHANDTEMDLMTTIWIIAGHHISRMYNKRIHSREGIG